MKDERFKQQMIAQRQSVCGTGGKQNCKNCADRLIDHVFSRKLLLHCSLYGGSRASSGSVANCGLKTHIHVYDFFIQFILKADINFNLQKQDDFIETVLKNKKARAACAESGIVKVTKRKNRPKNLLYVKKSKLKQSPQLEPTAKQPPQQQAIENQPPQLEATAKQPS